jgi:3-keto-5-aminohexanoate cleavage enzyme
VTFLVFPAVGSKRFSISRRFLEMRKVIITVALSGGLHDRRSNPYLPEQPEEIVKEAVACSKAGAAVVHIHARDPQGRVTADAAIYGRINRLIREQCDVIVNNTTGVGPGHSAEQRSKVLDARPDVASFNMGTMVRTKFEPGSIFLNTREEIEQIARLMLEKGVKPELEAFSQPMFVEIQNLIEKGLVKKPYWVNIVIGSSNQGAIPANIQNLLSMVDYFRACAGPDANFCVTVIGRSQLHLTTLGCLLGGHIRVGMEDNLYLERGVLAKSNVEFVTRTVNLLRILQMEPATAQEAREIMGIGY